MRGKTNHSDRNKEGVETAPNVGQSILRRLHIKASDSEIYARMAVIVALPSATRCIEHYANRNYID